MGKKITFLCGLVFLILSLSLINIGFGGESESKYMGVFKCKICHANVKLGGTEYQVWEKSTHAKAYQTLASEKAKAKAKELGIDDPQKSEKCYKCHVTGYGVDKSRFDQKFKIEDGVQCEECHGPGEGYYPRFVMQKRDESIKKGLVIPDEKVCVKCHNEESPFYKKFNFKEFFAKMDHKGLGTSKAGGAKK